MDCKDLMVGDWVICNHYQDKPFTKQFGVADFTKGEYEFCEPIPLTEDILVKNRFALDKSLAEIGIKVYTRPCPTGDLSVKVFHDGSIRFGFIKLTYAHQLQHLLKLAGVQKEIEL